MLTDLDTLRLRFEASERESEHGFNLHKYGIGYADEATQARWEAWIACRAAILHGADRPQNEPQNIPENIPATQFEPVADLYGLTSPTGSETSFTFDAVEARDFIDGGWSCQEYVELGRFQEAMLQNGNSPAQSDCCPEQNYIAPAQDGDSPVIPEGLIAAVNRLLDSDGSRGCYSAIRCYDAHAEVERLLSAAPQQEV